VLRVDIASGRVEADVQGSRYEPYRIVFRVKSLTERQWEKAIETLASQALFAAKLLSGEMPQDRPFTTSWPSNWIRILFSCFGYAGATARRY
jgi:uncharacterized Zn finger protein